MDAAHFRQVMAYYPTGVVVVTAQSVGSRPAAMTIGSFTSVSLDPPLVAFFPAKNSTSWPKIREAGRFCVNVLGAHQQELCRSFAAKSADRFSNVSWRPGKSGSPILDGVIAWIDCDLYSVSEAGDHFIVTGAVRAMQAATNGVPLLFFGGEYGHFAPLATTSSRQTSLNRQTS